MVVDNARVLIADNDPVHTERLCLALTQEGLQDVQPIPFQPFLDQRGLPSLPIKTLLPVQAAIIDPTYDGRCDFTLIAALHTAAPHARIIVVTECHSLAHVVRAIKAGADDYLLKQCVQIEEVVRSVRYLPSSEPESRPVRSIGEVRKSHLLKTVQSNGVNGSARAMHMNRRTVQRMLIKCREVKDERK